MICSCGFEGPGPSDEKLLTWDEVLLTPAFLGRPGIVPAAVDQPLKSAQGLGFGASLPRPDAACAWSRGLVRSVPSCKQQQRYQCIDTKTLGQCSKENYKRVYLSNIILVFFISNVSYSFLPCAHITTFPTPKPPRSKQGAGSQQWVSKRVSQAPPTCLNHRAATARKGRSEGQGKDRNHKSNQQLDQLLLLRHSLPQISQSLPAKQELRRVPAAVAVGIDMVALGRRKSGHVGIANTTTATTAAGVAGRAPEQRSVRRGCRCGRVEKTTSTTTGSASASAAARTGVGVRVRCL